MLKATINDFVKKIYSSSNEVSKPKEQKIKLRNLLWVPLKELFVNFKEFFVLSLIFSFFMTIVSLLSNNSIICGITFSAQSITTCAAPNELSFLLFHIFRFIIITFYIKGYYNYVIEHQPMDFSKMFVPSWHDAKILSVLVFFIFINFVPAVSYYILLMREPNPDWIIESLYFTFISIGFVLPFLAILYYVIFAYIIEGKKCPSFKQISAAVFDNAGKIIISTLFTITIGLLVIIYYIGAIMPYTNHLSFIKVCLFEICYNVILLMIVALMTNYIFHLRNILFTKKE